MSTGKISLCFSLSGVPQTYGNYGNYQQPQQQQQAQPQQQPDQYNQQTPQQPTNQGYNAGNFNQPAQPNNFPQNGLLESTLFNMKKKEV